MAARQRQGTALGERRVREGGVSFWQSYGLHRKVPFHRPHKCTSKPPLQLGLRVAARHEFPPGMPKDPHRPGDSEVENMYPGTVRSSQPALCTSPHLSTLAEPCLCCRELLSLRAQEAHQGLHDASRHNTTSTTRSPCKFRGCGRAASRSKSGIPGKHMPRTLQVTRGKRRRLQVSTVRARQVEPGVLVQLAASKKPTREGSTAQVKTTMSPQHTSAHLRTSLPKLGFLAEKPYSKNGDHWRPRLCWICWISVLANTHACLRPHRTWQHLLHI